MKIRHLKHHDIDKKTYDDRIIRSAQGTVYATSWYLDAVSPGWELLATDDSEIVMPIPLKKKFGLKYSVQPPLCQQLGLFSSIPLDENNMKSFIDRIPYSRYRLQLNSGNIFQNQSLPLRQNYLLDLNQSYTDIREKYKTNCQRNIRKAETEALKISKNTLRDEYIDILKKNSFNRPIINLLPLLNRLMDFAEKNTSIEIWNVRDKSENILSCVFFLYWKNRVYYMVPVSTPEGKNSQSMSFLIDQFIHHHASSELILDFEGSSIPNIARFYEGFGADPEYYPVVKKDNFLTKIYSAVRN